MRLINFTFDSPTTIGIDGRPRYFDLHNVYTWQGFSYFSTQQKIRMSWLLPQDSTPDPAPSLPSALVLEFRGVSQFDATSANPEMPYEWDTVLKFIKFSPNGDTSEENWPKPLRNVSGYVWFRFVSDIYLHIWAEEAELMYGQAESRN